MSEVWAKLAKKGNHALVAERLDFSRHLVERGLGQLEGTRYQARTREMTADQVVDYMCKDDLVAACHGNEERAAAIIETALQDGEGMGLGWYMCPNEKQAAAASMSSGTQGWKWNPGLSTQTQW